MAIFESELRTLILDGAPLIKTMAPEALQRDAELPGIVYTSIIGDPDFHMTGKSSHVFQTIQLDIWSDRYSTCKEAAIQVREYLHAITPRPVMNTFTIQSILITTERDGEGVDETDSRLKHQIILEADIHYHTT